MTTAWARPRCSRLVCCRACGTPSWRGHRLAAHTAASQWDCGWVAASRLGGSRSGRHRTGGSGEMGTLSRRRVTRSFCTVTAAGALILGSAATLGSSLASAAPAPAAAPSTLAQAFNNVGITSSASPASGNFDGIGDSFSASGLARDALTPGGSLLHDGQKLSWPDVPAGQPDNVVADGQVIALSGQGSTLGVVGASDNGSASGTFTVSYADGTTTTASL